MSTITIEQYSEKAIVVRGNTIPYKEKLLSIGGKWNKLLKGGEGWIFPLTKKPIVEKTLSEPPSVHDNNDSNSPRDKNNENNENDKNYTKKSYKISKTYNDTSSEVVLTKKEYLHLISRIERLEQLVAQTQSNSNESSSSSSSNSYDKEEKVKKYKNTKSKNIPPLLSSINDSDICNPEDYDNMNLNEDVEERDSFQPLLRKKKVQSLNKNN
jgi:hypothetical protein